ncbi:alpha/beta hydrolase [Tenacibaculum finnmarkense]|nr:alpha/beta hydrolase [Tenacibaculum finnmarkense]
MENYIIYKNIKIFYTESGKGNPLVLLHGFLESSKMWEDMVCNLSKTNRVICIDLLGHGKTDSLTEIHTMQAMALAVKSVLKTLNIEQFYIVGHSMGGYVALALAEKYPKKIKGICLLNSSATSDDQNKKKLRERACKMAKTNYEILLKMSISNLFTAKNKADFPAEIAQTKKEAFKITAQSYISASQGMRLRANTEAVLQRIENRLIIAGKNDAILNFKEISEQAKRTNTPLHKLSGGHMSPIDNKKILLKILQKFITD